MRIKFITAWYAQHLVSWLSLITQFIRDKLYLCVRHLTPLVNNNIIDDKNNDNNKYEDKNNCNNNAQKKSGTNCNNDDNYNENDINRMNNTAICENN